MGTEYQKFFFDFDSTLIQAESLDLLAERKGCGETVRNMTAKSMNGEVPFEEVFERKVSFISPRRHEVEAIGEECSQMVVAGARETIGELQAQGREVYILSSTFWEIIAPTAELLGIAPERVLSNRFLFSPNGAYKGIDTCLGIPLAAGKKRILEFVLSPEERMRAVMVGDSVCDLKCRQAVGLFIGFGGVVVRERVRAESDMFIRQMSEIKSFVF